MLPCPIEIKKGVHMIGLEKIEKSVELAIWSAYIKGEQPVSLLITSQVEAGKTELVMQYAQNLGCVVLTDATAFGIMRDYGQAIINKEIRTIIIPDLIKPMSRGKDTVQTLVTFLNSLIEEGVCRISTYAERLGAPSSGVNLQTQPIPIKCGLITTIAQGELLDGRHHWTRIGFMSRLVPISYEYNATTQYDIHKSIAEREYRSDKAFKLTLPVKDVEVKLEQAQADELLSLSSLLTARMHSNKTEKVYGFRLQKNIQRLAMASALSRGKDVVEQEDINILRKIAPYINLEYMSL
jgi:hypothetical protein